MLTLILGLALFLGVHSVSIVAPSWRDHVARRLGIFGWRALYAVIAVIGFVLVIRGYAAAKLEPVVLYVPPAGLRHLSAVLMLPVFVLLLAAYLPGRIRTATRHPMLLATKLWALAHLLANGMAADVLLFGGFLVWAVLDRISLKRRAPPAIQGALNSRFNDAIAVIGGLVVYALFVTRWHAALFGVAPFG